MPRRIMKRPMQLKKELQERFEAKERAKDNMYLTGGQAKLDKNKNNKLDAQDFKILRKEKAKGRGMGLQDEKLKPGKVKKAMLGTLAVGAGLLGAKFLKDRKKKASKMPGMAGAGIMPGETVAELYKKKMQMRKMGGKVIKAKRGTRLDFPVINRVKINKKSLNKNLMKTKNPYSELVKTTAKGPPRYSSMAEMRKAKGFLPGESAEDFNKRRMKLQRASKALRATRIGKIALGVAAAAMAGKEYLKSKSKKKEKKMGGGMMQKPMGYDIGGGVSKAKEHKKILKDKVGTALGYMGEMTKNIGRATPILAAQEVANLIKNKRTISMEEAKKQREEDAKKRVSKDFYLKFLKNRKSRPKLEMQEYKKDGGMMDNPKPKSQQKFRGRAQPKGARRLRGVNLSDFGLKHTDDINILDLGLESSKYKDGGSVTAKCKLGRNKPTKIY